MPAPNPQGGAEPRVRMFDSLGLKLNFLEWGDPEAPPLLFVHGGLDNAWSWSDLAQMLCRDWRVIALDQRGHGDSDWSMGGDYHTHAFLGDLASFITQVIGGPTAIVAHSMGARLSLYLAGAAPQLVSDLVAIEGLGGRRPPAADAGPGGEKVRRWIEDRARRQAAGQVVQVGDWLRSRATFSRTGKQRPYANLDEAVARLLDGDEKGLTPAQALSFATTNMRADEAGRLTWKCDPVVKWYLGMEAGESDRASYYAAIRCPLLHLYGEDSQAFPPPSEDMAHFNNAQLKAIANAGHWVHLNQTEAVAAAVRSFLRGGDA